MSTTKPLRAKFIAALKAGGALTASQAASVVGADRNTARNYLCRLVKDGLAKANRSTGHDGQKVHVEYEYVTPTTISRDINKPRRPVSKEWTLNMVRDPLVAAFFGPAHIKLTGE